MDNIISIGIFILLIYAIRITVKVKMLERALESQTWMIERTFHKIEKLNSSGGKPSARQMEAGVSESLPEIRSPENCVPKSPASIPKINQEKSFYNLLEEEKENEKSNQKPER